MLFTLFVSFVIEFLIMMLLFRVVFVVLLPIVCVCVMSFVVGRRVFIVLPCVCSCVSSRSYESYVCSLCD